jgi:uncharacterized protein (TIGR03437 family)
MPSIVDGTEVLFNDVRAPILAALSSQLNVVAPFRLEGRVKLEIKRNGERIYWRQFQSLGSSPDPLVRVSAEGRLTQWPDRQFTVLADAINQDGSPNSADNPAVPGSVVTVFVTGLGEFDAPVWAADYGDGKTRPANRYVVRTSSERADEAKAVTILGRTVGVTAVRLRVPDNARRVLHFWIEPPNSTPNFAPTNFVHVRE